MKKIFIISFLISFTYIAQAQINTNALGLRLGGNGDINGAEISYQQSWSDENRLEFDLGFGGNKHHSRVYLVGLYHWVWGITDGLNWYAGPGATAGFFSFDDDDGIDNYFNIGVGGQIGLEYDFNEMDAPILISLDARPMFDLIGDQSGFGWGAALGIRYTW